MAATGNEFETDQEETPSSSHLLVPQSASNQQQVYMAVPAGNNEEHLVLQDEAHVEDSPSGSGYALSWHHAPCDRELREQRDVQENQPEPRLSVVSLSANASAASQSGSQHDSLNAFITQSSSISYVSHNVPHGGRGSGIAGRQPRSRPLGGPGSAPNTVSRRQRHDSPSLARTGSKREISALGKPMVRSSSKPELHSGSKPKAVSSSVLTPKGREGRAKSALATTGPTLGASSLRPLQSNVPSALSKGAFATNGKLCPPSGLIKAPALTSSAPSRAATPPDSIKRPIPLAKQLKEVVRRWYKFDKSGRMSIIQAGKHELTQSLGVHLRDLRILDTSRNPSYASCILCREHALVINLEFIQVIVTCDTALVVNAERAHEPQVQTFIEDLQHRLALAGGALSADPSGDGATSADSPPRSGAAAHVHDNTDLTANGDVQEVGPGGHEPPEALEVPRDEPHDSGENHCVEHDDEAATEMAAGMPGSAREALETEVSYELKVLEACLDHTSASMAKEVQAFEADSTAALDALAQRVTAGNLDAVRRVKNRMVRLNTRVETVRTLLEKYLADDADLAELHLSGQRILEEHRQEKLRLREERRAERLTRYELKRQRRLEDDPCASEPSSVSNSTFTLSEDDDGWLSRQAEMVLEPYFMSLDSTWSRLQCSRHEPALNIGPQILNFLVFGTVVLFHFIEAAIGEFIDDTEDYVNITLDSHRNQLIQVDLLLTAATFCVGLVTLIAGLFGMNLFSGLDTSANLGTLDNDYDDPDDAEKSTDHTFVLVSVLSCVLAIVLLIAFVLFMRYKQLAFV